MIVKTFIVGELQTNCYLVYDQETKEGIIIDPAGEAAFLSEQILREKIDLQAIIATHGHFDHVLGAWELQLNFSLPLLVHPKDVFLVKKMAQSASWWLKRKIIERPPEKIKAIQEGDKITIGKTLFKVIDAPGHSPGGICLYAKKENVLFTGDTLFAQGVGRTDFLYASSKDLNKSLVKLSLLPPETIIYPGHGPSTSLKKALRAIGF